MEGDRIIRDRMEGIYDDLGLMKGDRMIRMKGTG